MRILYLCANYQHDAQGDHWDGSAHYRCLLPARWIADKTDLETFVCPRAVNNKRTGWLCGQMPSGEIIDGAEIVIVKDWLSVVAKDCITRARECGQIVIGDCDDWLLAAPKSHIFSRAYAHRQDKNAGAWRAGLFACNAITVSTSPLARFFSNMRGCPPVYILRNAIDFDSWISDQTTRNDQLTLGWTGNPTWRADDMSVIRGWIGRFVRENDLRFFHVGQLPGDRPLCDILRIDPERFEARPMLSFGQYRASSPLAGVDLQLIPLKNDPYNEAKSALKGLESIAMGVPFVETRTTSYQEIFPYEAPGDLEKRTELALYDDTRAEMLLQQTVMAGKQSIALRWHEWLEVYLGVGS